MNSPPKYIYTIITQEGTIKDSYSTNVLAMRMCPNGCYILKYKLESRQ